MELRFLPYPPSPKAVEEGCFWRIAQPADVKNLTWFNVWSHTKKGDFKLTYNKEQPQKVRLFATVRVINSCWNHLQTTQTAFDFNTFCYTNQTVMLPISRGLQFLRESLSGNLSNQFWVNYNFSMPQLRPQILSGCIKVACLHSHSLQYLFVGL